MPRDSNEIRIAQAGDVYVAPAGTPLPPAVDTPLHADFYNVGYITAEGVELLVAPEIERLGSWQEFPPIRMEMVQQKIVVSFDMVQWNAETVVFAFGHGGAVTEFAPGEFRFDWPGGDDADVDERSMVVDWRDGDQAAMRLVLERGSIVPGFQTSFVRSQLARLPIAFDALAVIGGRPGYLFMTTEPAPIIVPPDPPPPGAGFGDGAFGDDLFGD